MAQDQAPRGGPTAHSPAVPRRAPRTHRRSGGNCDVLPDWHAVRAQAPCRRTAGNLGHHRARILTTGLFCAQSTWTGGECERQPPSRRECASWPKYQDIFGEAPAKLSQHVAKSAELGRTTRGNHFEHAEKAQTRATSAKPSPNCVKASDTRAAEPARTLPCRQGAQRDGSPCDTPGPPSASQVEIPPNPLGYLAQ